MNAQRHAPKETRYVPKDMLERRRKECNPVWLPSGVIVAPDIQSCLTALFGPCELDYERGFGYVVKANQATILIGGKHNDMKYLRQWIQDNQPVKAVVVAGFWESAKALA